ncbi:MAG: asparaginase, partial [Nocardioidaceae bacterium]
GVERSPIAMNCSGKHAAMLATCVRNDWDVSTYRSADHPLQLAIAEAFSSLTGEPIKAVAVDGCGAPLFSASLTGLAQAFRTLSLAAEGPEAEVARAFREYPEFASGTRRDERTLLRAIPGAIGKAGAESCYAVGLADGRAVALKIDDGAQRARPVLMAAALRRMGVDTEPGVDSGAVRATGVHPMLGGGEPVGAVRPLI